jgi:fructose-bisphosphate aldolase class 1
VRRAVTVIEASRVPLDTGLVLVRALERKFPQAPLDAVLAAVERLVPAWARFDDWMGAVSLLRAVPSLRGVDPVVFADAMVAWLATEEDLFDALRAFSRLEAGGQRPVLEVLESLRGAAEAAR